MNEAPARGYQGRGSVRSRTDCRSHHEADVYEVSLTSSLRQEAGRGDPDLTRSSEPAPPKPPVSVGACRYGYAVNMRGNSNSTRTAVLIVVAVLAFFTFLGGGAWLVVHTVFRPVSLPEPPKNLPSPWPETGAEPVRAVPMPTGEMAAALPDYTAGHVLCSALPEPTWAKQLGGPVLREVSVVSGCTVVSRPCESTPSSATGSWSSRPEHRSEPPSAATRPPSTPRRRASTSPPSSSSSGRPRRAGRTPCWRSRSSSASGIRFPATCRPRCATSGRASPTPSPRRGRPGESFPDTTGGRPASVENPSVTIQLTGGSPQQVQLAWLYPRKSDAELRAWAESLLPQLLGR